jgi:acyl-CoA dehydrogenase
VNFDFSDEQRQMQTEVRRMLSESSTSAEARRVLEGQGDYSRTVWERLMEMGAAAAAIPEAYGGAGLGHLELCLVAEEAGRHLAAVPLSSSFYLAAEALRLAGSEAQRQAWLPRLARGEAIGTAALEEKESLSASQSLTFDGQRLSGALLVLPDGHVADVAVVRCGKDLVLVDLRSAGVSRKRLAGLDPTRPLASMSFDKARAERLPGGDGTTIDRVRDGAAVLLAFEQLGGADRVLEISRDYSMQRKAFGRPIGGFQALKHRMADMYVRNELARAHAWYGAWALSSEAPELPLAAAAARVAATTAYNFAAEENIEIHGGIGFTWQMDCHLYLRRARYLAQVLGSEHLWRGRVADALIEEHA